MINRIADLTSEANGSSLLTDRRRSDRMEEFKRLLGGVTAEPARAPRSRSLARIEVRPSDRAAELSVEHTRPERSRSAVVDGPRRGVESTQPARTRGVEEPAQATAETTSPSRMRNAGEARTQEATPQPTPATSTPTPEASGFVRSTSATRPSLLRFQQVPPEARFPDGPYRQAPAEFGGEWWHVNPFTGLEPWNALTFDEAAIAQQEAASLPEGFQRLFGTRPDYADFETRDDFLAASMRWEQDLASFQQTGLPEGFTESDLNAVRGEFEEWGLGEPVFYEGRYGWKVRFPDSGLPTFESSASSVFQAPHLVIARYQARSIEQGVTPQQFHPWLPDRLRSV